MSSPFQCSITLSTMENPVIAPDGYTYEQHAITAWLLENGTSPQTRDTMGIHELIPNRAIADLLAQNAKISSNHSAVPPANNSNNNNAKVNIRSLLAQLLDIETTIQQQTEDDGMSPTLLLLELMKNAACALALLNQNNIEKHADLIASASGFAPLIERAKNGTSVQKEKAVRALRCMARNNDVMKHAIGREGGIPPLVEILKNGTTPQKIAASSTLATLAINNENNRILIAKSGGIEQLVKLTRNGTHKQKEIGACALLQLAVHEDNKSIIARTGGIPPLVELVKHGTSAQKDNAMAALATLAVQHEDNRTLIADELGILPLIHLTQKGTNTQKDMAACALYSLSKNKNAGNMITQKGGIPSLLELSINGTTPTQKRYAAATVRFLSARII